jgi:adenylate cyclase
MANNNTRTKRKAGEIRDWLLERAVHIPDLRDALTELCERIVVSGVPIARSAAVVQLLNTSTQAVGLEWHLGGKTTERLFPYGAQSDRSYERSPYAQAHRSGEWVEIRPMQADPEAYGVVPELKAGGFTHYVCIPLTFSNGRKRNGATFATKHLSGFSAADLDFLRQLIPAMRSVMEIRAGERILNEILQTYVGGDPHERILAGDIHRGKVTRIKSALLFSDLRGFTNLSMILTEEDITDLLNRYFDCVVPEVEQRGGEVLKFIGDGVLAIFQESNADTVKACAQALAAAQASLARIARANSYGSLPAPLKAGIALHYGEAAYGNVGSGQRLDFTVIGRDVNIANRITRLNEKLAQPILMSQAFASHLGSATQNLGSFEFRGVPGEHALFKPLPDQETPAP